MNVAKNVLISILASRFNVPRQVVESCIAEILRSAEIILRSRMNRPTPPRMLVNQDLSEERYMEVTR
jgi:hypothetical protein